MKLLDRCAPWIVGLLTLAACAFASSIRPPKALTHDEFSYLLAAETFASGRLSLPTHEQWQHFETMHVLQQPSYASKYPPGQGLVLALGTRIGGRPIVGAWLSTAGAAAAIGWMLAGWFGSARAAWGGLAFGLHPCIVLLWGNTYWGGSLAALGGALVFGALPRIVGGPQGALERTPLRAGIALGTGLALLVLTRPFEGALAALPIGLALAAAHVRSTSGVRGHALRWAVPAAALLAASLSFVAVHDLAVTHDVLRLPYAEYHRQYEVAPLFLFQELAPAPEYRHEVLRQFFSAEAAVHSERRTWIGFLDGSARRLADLARFFGARGLVPLLLALLFVRRKGAVRVALASVALGLAAVLVETFGWPHYLAPFAAPATLLVARGAQHAWQVGERSRWLRVGVAVCVVAAFVENGAHALDVARTRAAFAPARDAVVADLAARGGRHLVVVRYAPEHNPHVEWVYNAADIDAAPIVWAREMGAARDRALVAAFPERSAWLLEPDRDPSALRPFVPEER